MLSPYMDDFSLVPYLLRALNNVAARSRLPPSSNALEVSRRLYLPTTQMSDTPVALLLPVSSKVLENMSEGGLEVQWMGTEVGELISRCSGLETGIQ